MESTKEGLMILFNKLDYMPSVKMLMGEYIYGEIKEKTHQNMCFLTIEAFGSGLVLHKFVMNKTATIFDVKQQIAENMTVYLGQTTHKLEDNETLQTFENTLEKTNDQALDPNRNMDLTLVIRLDYYEEVFLSQLRCLPIVSRATMEKVAKRGYLKCLQYLCEAEYQWSKDLFDLDDPLLPLKYMFENGCPYYVWLHLWVRYHDNLDCLAYLPGNDISQNSKYCSEAAKRGDLQLLQKLYENGCPLSVHVCTCASRYGHLNILQYARANDCPWDCQTCTLAARYGFLDCLRFAIENGCPHNVQKCKKIALNYNQVHVVEYLNAI